MAVELLEQQSLGVTWDEVQRAVPMMTSETSLAEQKLHQRYAPKSAADLGG